MYRIRFNRPAKHLFIFLAAFILGPCWLYANSYWAYPVLVTQIVLDSLAITLTALAFMRAFYLKGRHDEAVARRQP